MNEPGDSFERGEFRYRRRVEFAETDLAGLAHFSGYFRYMEEAEHALFRAAGLSVAGALRWPRAAAAGAYKAPLHFEDEVEVRLRARFGRTRIDYACVLMRDEVPVFTGTMTSVCARPDANGTLIPIELPGELVEKLRSALAQSAVGYH